MQDKTLRTLEYFKVIDRLSRYASFSASAELAAKLRPAEDINIAIERLDRTGEARYLLSIHPSLSVDGVRDVRTLSERAERGGVLEASEINEIKNTLVIARDLKRLFTTKPSRYWDTETAAGTDPESQNNLSDSQTPLLAAVANNFNPPAGLIDSISRCISENGEVLDQASEPLSNIRREMKVSHERLLSKLEKLVNDAKVAPILQEPIITIRNGRYVVPLRADFKGRMRCIVHDQSSSGATLFVEPLVVVDLNNRWHELQLAERDEIQAILAGLSNDIGSHSMEIHNIVRSLAELDMALMCARYAEDLQAAAPLLVPFKPETELHPGSTMRLYHARHPLLSHEQVVPIDVDIDDDTLMLVITGPNTGGKTVTLKTIGLLALMAQSGLHIPAQSGSSISVFQDIFADIGDEQSIEQSLSTFSGHIQNIIDILQKADSRSLVLLDELGSGTDPQEGAALAGAIMMHLLGRKVTCFIATHYPELKNLAHATAGVVNACMEFDLGTLLPTYQLSIGLPGRSNALLVAERLGLPLEIIDAARSTVDPHDLKSTDLLNDIYHQRDEARRSRSEAERARQEAESARAVLLTRLEQIEDERLAVLDKAREQAESEINVLLDELAALRRQMERSRQPVEELSSLDQKIDELKDALPEPAIRRSQPEAEKPKPLKPGDKVWLRSLKMQGVLTSLGEEEVEVNLGALRVRARLDDIRRGKQMDETPQPVRRRKPGSAAAPESILHPSPGIELDIRGERADEALEKLERHLELAYLAGQPFVRVIHGKGSGRLRQAVRQALRHSSHVSGWVAGLDNEGGEGVTVAHLAKAEE